MFLKNLNEEKQLKYIENEKEIEEDGIVIDDIFINNKNFLRTILKNKISIERKG